METQTLPALSMRLTREQLKNILSGMCDEAFVKYSLGTIFEFTGEYLPDVHRSGDNGHGTRGVECYLNFKKLSEDKDAPHLSLWTSNAEMNIHFSQHDVDIALIKFATSQRHVPQGANVNHKCEVQWLADPKAIVEVVIDVSYDDASDHQ